MAWKKEWSEPHDHVVFHVTQAGREYIKDRAIAPRAFLAKGQDGRADGLDARVRDHARRWYCQRNLVEPLTKQRPVRSHVQNVAFVRVDGKARVLL